MFFGFGDLLVRLTLLALLALLLLLLLLLLLIFIDLRLVGLSLIALLILLVLLAGATTALLPRFAVDLRLAALLACVVALLGLVLLVHDVFLVCEGTRRDAP